LCPASGAQYKDLAGLLKNAKIEFDEYWEPEDERHGRLTIRMANSLLHLYEQTDNEHLLDAAVALVPERYIAIIRVASLLDEINDDGTAVVVDNPYFGSPAKAAKFSCDVFVLMPFAEDFKPIYSDHIVPTATELHLSIKRGDDFFSQHSVMNDVWSALNACRLVIAECTGRNPNVYYELGIAHTLAKPVVLITQDVNDVPFDLRHLRLIEYSNTLAGAKLLKRILEKAIRDLLPAEKYDPDVSDIPF
jgi:hypothetical protein